MKGHLAGYNEIVIPNKYIRLIKPATKTIKCKRQYFALGDWAGEVQESGPDLADV
jgi:hypothetical protein